MYHNFKVYNELQECLYFCIKMKNDIKLVDLYYTNTLNKTVWIDSVKKRNFSYKLMSFDLFENFVNYEWLFKYTIYKNYLHYEKMPLL